MCKPQYLATYMLVTIEQNTNFKQNIQKNRLKIKELLERKIGEKKSKIGSSLAKADLYGVCIAYIHEGVISAPFTGAMQHMH